MRTGEENTVNRGKFTFDSDYTLRKLSKSNDVVPGRRGVWWMSGYRFEELRYNL